jgi:two-component system OmpR family sensor kinase
VGSFLVIITLWIFFYIQQKHQNEEHQISRYFSVISSLQPLIMQSYIFQDSDVSNFNMKIFTPKDAINKKILFERGDKSKGFTVLKIDNKTVIHTYNKIGELYLEDLQKNSNYILIHTVFIVLLLLQFLLYLMLQKSLKPLQTIHYKLKNLQKGDMTTLEYQSKYDEINQIVSSYNNSISQLDYILETREMFNKIFMHELKMPIAKGMFYLKLEPSKEVNEKMMKLMRRLNSELDEFSILESLIVNKNDIENKEHNFLELINLAIEKLGVEQNENIKIEVDRNSKIYGGKELWIVCIKNLLDNALKYSNDKKVNIDYLNDEIVFSNKGEPLPIDLSSNLKNWKIDKNNRHKSSTGYGFGLFIIKNIINLNGYILNYEYENKNVIIRIKKCIML